jgi:hypothetical protein
MKRICIAVSMILVVAFAALIFVQVPTRQGVNFKVQSYTMPLYIKIFEFIDRDFHYKRIVKAATDGKISEKDRVLAIFRWCVENIKHQPAGLPVIDDHPLNIIIRGYGVEDQFEDVFTILCTYNGIEAFYERFQIDPGNSYSISFTKIDGKWYAFSVYAGAYPSRNGELVPIGEVAKDPDLLRGISSNMPGFRVDTFLEGIKSMEFKATSLRVKGQNPMGRLMYYLKKLVKK